MARAHTDRKGLIKKQPMRVHSVHWGSVRPIHLTWSLQTRDYQEENTRTRNE